MLPPLQSEAVVALEYLVECKWLAKLLSWKQNSTTRGTMPVYWPSLVEDFVAVTAQAPLSLIVSLWQETASKLVLPVG